MRYKKRTGIARAISLSRHRSSRTRSPSVRRMFTYIVKWSTWCLRLVYNNASFPFDRVLVSLSDYLLASLVRSQSMTTPRQCDDIGNVSFGEPLSSLITYAATVDDPPMALSCRTDMIDSGTFELQQGHVAYATQTSFRIFDISVLSVCAVISQPFSCRTSAS